jgi:hypothetical protein
MFVGSGDGPSQMLPEIFKTRPGFSQMDGVTLQSFFYGHDMSILQCPVARASQSFYRFMVFN